VNGFLALVIVCITVYCYFLPSVIAFSKQHHQRYAILVLNILAGWTGVFWLAALIWSLTARQLTYADLHQEPTPQWVHDAWDANPGLRPKDKS
jgi:hypothetical protein